MNKMFNKNLEIEFFDNYYKSGYDVFLEKTYLKVLNIMLKLLPELHSKVLLEIGCGSGAFTRYLTRLDLSKIYAIDLSPKLI